MAMAIGSWRGILPKLVLFHVKLPSWALTWLPNLPLLSPSLVLLLSAPGLPEERLSGRLCFSPQAAFDQRMKMWQRWQDAQTTLQKKREAEARLLWANKPDKLQQAKDEITEVRSTRVASPNIIKSYELGPSLPGSQSPARPGRTPSQEQE